LVEIGQDEYEELDCQYVEPISMVALHGVETMMAKPPEMPWHEYWAVLADGMSPLTWWEVADVDDESYGYELLFKTWTCHPRSVLAEGPGWFDHVQVDRRQDRR